MALASVAHGLPFSAETTSRESIRLIVPTPGGVPTPAQLTQPSAGLVFQETASGNLSLAFESLDESLDDSGADRCSTNGRRHI